MLTLKEVQATLPIGSRGNMTQDMVNQLNALSKDPEEAKVIRDNFITYAEVLQEGRFKVGDYTSAVMYVSYKAMGFSNLKAWKATFPARYKKMEDAGKPAKDIASHVSSYNKGILVNKVYARSYIPTWVLNQDMFQKALNTQYELMVDVTVSDKVRSDAANSILTHLKKPEENKAQLSIDIHVSDGMAEMENALNDMSRLQLKLITEDSGISAHDIASMPIKTIEHVERSE